MIKTRTRKWVECQYCHRNVYRGEVVYKVRGMRYFVCRKCYEKGGESSDSSRSPR